MRIGDGYTGPEMIGTTAWVAAAIVLSIGLALTGGAVIWKQQRARAEAQALQERQVERLQDDLVKRLTMPVYGLKGARGTLAAMGGRVTRSAFRAYVESRDLPREFPGARGFGFIERVEQADLAAFVAARRRDGAPDFDVHGLGQESTHYIVSEIEPLARNAAAWGLDSGANPVRRQAIEQAVDSGEATLSSPTPLVQDRQQGPGFLLLVPVYKQGRDPGTPAERRAALLGLLYAPLVASELLQGATDQAASLLDLNLSARTLDGQFAPLLATRNGRPLPPAEAADASITEEPTAQSLRFTVAGREFLLEAALTREAAMGLLGLSGVGLELGGALLSLMFAVTVYLLAVGRARAEQLAQDMTADLARLARVADEARQSLQDLYDNAPCAYYALDADGRFLQINALGLKWLGSTAEELVGRMSPRDFFDEAGRAQFDAAFPRFKAEGRISGLEFDLTGRQGQARRVSLSATAVYGPGGEYLRSRSVMFDISETHRIRQQLHQLTLDQEAMLESDLVGIVKLRDRRSIWHNRALERMFGYAEGELAGAAARQLYADDTAFHALGALAYPQLRAGGRFRTQQQMRRKDGALIWVDLAGVELPGSDGSTLWMLVDITQSKAHEARMERAALHDALTGVPNRVLLADRLRQAIRAAERNGHVFALAYLDLNGFKQINDTHGHDAGDVVLKAVAARLLASLRASDTVARLGGDEFVVLLTPAQAPADVEPVLSRLLDALSQPVTLNSGELVAVGASLGLAHYPTDGRTPEALMRRADEAMFANKRAGRARASTR
ncbi:CHASE domain-containing protein [Pelomonas sp. P7]|uniref:CHASE domain-containing protein n=1 Tax=Pelomonas caseinilytica TaxID=2906763 RepID=A0ABS8XFS6_9BURK|nr:CHASE domain-containing protein [Pelomonas sp. P7]MCE4537418.1 CHASE domain-containing protein [Pelomonas sp. P7]